MKKRAWPLLLSPSGDGVNENQGGLTIAGGNSGQTCALGRAISRLAKLFVLFVSLIWLATWGGNASAAIITSTATGGLWSAGATWVGGVAPLATDSAVIATGATVTLGANTGVVALTINSGSILNLSTFRIRPTGMTSISGTINLGTSTASRFTGVTINTGGLWSNASNVIIAFLGGGLTNNGGTFTAGTGIQTFGTTAQAIGGTSPITIPNLAVATIAVTNNGNLTVSTALTGTTGSLVNGATGTLNLGGTSAITTLTATAVGNTVNYTGAAQTVKATTYHHLGLGGSLAKTLTNVSTINGNLTLSGTATATTAIALAIGGNLDVGAGTTFTSANFTNSVTGTTSVSGTLAHSGVAAKTYIGAVTINAGGIWTNAGNAPVTFRGGLTHNGTTFTSGTGIYTFDTNAQAIGGTTAITISNLTVTGVTLTNNGTLTASTTLAGTGGLTNAATRILNIGGTSSITTLTNQGTATITGAGAISTALANFTNTGTLNLNGSGTITGITNSGIINLTSSGTITALTNNAAGTLNISTTPTVPTITTLTATAVGNTVNYSGAGAQTVKATTYSNLGLSGSGAKAMGATTINGNFTMSGTATTAPTGALTVGGDFTIGATNTFTAGALAHSVGGNWSNSGTFTAGTSTVTFNGTAAQTIGGAATTSFNNLTIANIGAGSTTLGINTSVAGNLSVNTGTLDLATFTLNRTAAGGTLAVANGATLKIGGTNGFPANYTTHTLGTTSTVEYSGTNQSVGAEIAPGYGNLTISGSGSKTAAGDVTVGGTLTLAAGTFAVGANTLTLNGPTIAGTPANLSTTAASSLSFGGTASGINVPSSVALLNNLTVNNSNGITLNSSPALSGVLTLTSGAVTTGANILGTSASCSASIVRAGGFVNGNLRLTFPTGTTTCTYHVGSGTNYAPIGVTMVTTLLGGGTLTGSTTGNEHPQVASSGIDSSLDVNRYWTLWSSGDTVSASSYGATFNFVAGDKDALATPTSFIVGKYASSAWTLPAPVTAGATSTGVSSIAGPINSVTDFVAGEAVFVCSVPSGLPAGMTCECDNFNRASVNPSTIFGGNYTLTQSSGTPGWPQIANLGLLQMTNNSGNMATSATVPGTFPAAGNIVSVEFRHYAYKTGGAVGADGIAVTLSDSSIVPLAGAFGGSLGYAQKTIAGGAPVDVNGFAGGWVGVGIDEWGNFSAATEGRVGGPAQTAQSVSVRGSGAGLTGYPYLAGTATLSPVLDNTSSATPARGDAYRVQVDARCYQNSFGDCAAINPTALQYAEVSVYRDTTGAGTFNVGNRIVNFEAYATAVSKGATQANVPATWKLSYTGSTGGSTNFHELGALKVCGQTFVPPAGYRIQVDNLTPSTCGTPGGSPSSPIVTVTALDTNGNPVTTYNKTVTLSAPLSGGGASSAVWSLKSGNGTFSGGNQYTFVAADLGVAQFYLTDASPQSVTITVSENGGTISSSLAPPPIVYSGGSFTIANIDALAGDTGGGVVAGRSHLMSVTRSNGCVTDTTYIGAKSLDGWYTPATGDHPVGALAPQLCATNISGTCLPSTGACQELSIAEPSVVPLSNNMPTLTFASGIANFCIATSDVGKYSVSLRDDSATPVSGSSGTLTVRPFAVVVSGIKQGATNNPANGTSGGSIFAKAGTAFQATVGGYLWNSAGDTGSNGLPGAVADWSAVTAAGIAPGYADTVTLAAAAPFAPAAGVLSNGNVAVASGSTTATTLSYDEVGSFTLTAAPATSYLSSGVNLDNRVAIFSNPLSTSRNGLVGRFIPDHFTVVGAVANACTAGIFTYMGQNFTLSTANVVEARNFANGVTQNYAASYAPGSVSFGAENADNGTDLSARLSFSVGSWVTGAYLLSSTNASFSRPATTVSDATWGPFELLDIGLSVTDVEVTSKTTGAIIELAEMDPTTSGSCGTACPYKKLSGSGTMKLRFGRLKLSNAHGSELLALPIPLRAEYYASSSVGFITNVDDSCTVFTLTPVVSSAPTSYQYGDLLISNALVNMTVTASTPTFTSNPVNAGLSTIRLSAPGSGRNGSVGLALTVPAWLQYPWGGGAAINPTARATFGVYKGNNEFIYLRENY